MIARQIGPIDPGWSAAAPMSYSTRAFTAGLTASCADPKSHGPICCRSNDPSQPPALCSAVPAPAGTTAPRRSQRPLSTPRQPAQSGATNRLWLPRPPDRLCFARWRGGALRIKRLENVIDADCDELRCTEPRVIGHRQQGSSRRPGRSPAHASSKARTFSPRGLSRSTSRTGPLKRKGRA
ncbi:hypothetical protein NVSP9465_03919 [Novosphingobium sp. CECT 9465]|nr:hypothetical protein NVSP9465_03919 [Novosphingobium sp. CECT 9465]